MATNFETKIAITGFVRTTATRQLAVEGVEWSADRLQMSPTLRLRDVATATTFWLSMGHNFGCVIVAARYLILGVGFRGHVI